MAVKVIIPDGIPGIGGTEFEIHGMAEQETMEAILDAVRKTEKQKEADQKLAQKNIDEFSDVVNESTTKLSDFEKAADQITTVLSPFGKVITDVTSQANQAIFGLAANIANGTDDFSQSLSFLPKMLGSVVSGLIKGIGNLASEITKVIPIIGDGLGSVVKSVANSMGDAAGVIVEEGTKIILNQVQKQYSMYTDLTSRGVLFGRGITDLTEKQIDLSLTMEEFKSTVETSSSNLLIFGGTAAGGLEKISSIASQWSEDQKKQMRLLGISYKEQAEGLTEFLEIQAIAGRRNFKDTEGLSKLSKEYMENLQVISSITGEDAKKAKERARAAMLEIAVRKKLAELGPEAAAKFAQAQALAGEEGGKALAEKLVLGFTKNVGILNSPINAILDDLLSNVQTAGVTQEEMVMQYTKQMTTSADAILKASENWYALSAGAIAGANIGAQGDALLKTAMEQQRLAIQFGNRNQELEEKRIESARKGADALTQSLINASQSLRNMQVTIQDKILENMESFGTLIEKSTSTIEKALNALVDALPGGRNEKTQEQAAKKKTPKISEFGGFDDTDSNRRIKYDQNRAMYRTRATIKNIQSYSARIAKGDYGAERYDGGEHDFFSRHSLKDLQVLRKEEQDELVEEIRKLRELSNQGSSETAAAIKELIELAKQQLETNQQQLTIVNSQLDEQQNANREILRNQKVNAANFGVDVTM